MLCLHFFLCSPTHNIWDNKSPKYVHTCAEICKRLVDALYHVHSGGVTSKGFVCFRAIEDAVTPDTVFASDTRPFIQTLKRFVSCVHVLVGVPPTKVVNGELTTRSPSRSTWILLELDSSHHPRKECFYRAYDFRPRSVSWMLHQTSAGAVQDSLVSFNVDVRCEHFHHESKSWTPPRSQPAMKRLGEFGDVCSFFKYLNRYFAGTRHFASADAQNNSFPFEDTIASKVPCSAYSCFTYSMLPSRADEFYQVVCSHAHFVCADVQIMPHSELRGEHFFYLIPLRETMQKHPGELLPWEIMGTPIGKTKALGLLITSTQVRGKYSIFCTLDTSKVIPAGTLSPLQAVAQTLFHDGGVLFFSVQYNCLMCFTSGAQYGSRV